MERTSSPVLVNAVHESGYDDFVPGRSTAMRAVEEIAKDWSVRKIPILLVGEADTGKRALATQIHQKSAAMGGMLRIVDCSRLTSQMVAECWNSTNGNGRKENSPAGTFLLENICDLSPALQSSMFPWVTTVLASETNNAAGLIATSDRELQLDVHAGTFREDLYYLISGVTVTIAPLRYRREDILPLVDFFLETFARELGRPRPTLTTSMQRFLLDYPWPGNIAELRDTARVIVAFGDAVLALAALRSRAQEVQRGGKPHNLISLKQAARAAARQVERDLILKVLARTRWNRKRAAQELQISYKAMLYKLKQVGLTAKFSEKEQA